MSLFYMYFSHCSFVYSSTLSFPQFSIIAKLNETNYSNGKNELSDNPWMNVCFEHTLNQEKFDISTYFG